MARVQRFADWTQGRTGLTCHQQSAGMHLASVAACLAGMAWEAAHGTLTMPGMAYWVMWGAAAALLWADTTAAVADRMRLAETLGMAHIAVLVVIVNGYLFAGTAAWAYDGLRGRDVGLWTEAWVGFMVMGTGAAMVRLKEHRAAAAAFADGRLPAAPPPMRTLWLCPAMAVLTGAVAAVRWPSGDAALIAVAWTAHAAGIALGQCRPRPPSSRRRRRSSWAASAKTA